VLSKTQDAGLHPISVQNNATRKNVLAIQGAPLDDSISNGVFEGHQIIAKTTGIGGAFNILDLFLKGGEFLEKTVVCPPTNNGCMLLPPLIAYWEKGVTEDTFYEETSNFISVSSLKGDTDEYDDTILLHEYGHFVATQLAHDDSEGGQHVLQDVTEDIRLAWSEGWATFFASAVLNNPMTVDTKGQGAPLQVDIETFKNFPSVFYTTSEAAISGMLWDFLDTAASGDQDNDPAAIGFDKIWKGFTGMTGPATMESFALALIRQNKEATDPIQTVLQGRKIELFPDTGEVEEGPLLLGNTQHHTLFKETLDTDSNPFPDDDLISLSVNAGQKYTVETLNLTNGADTFLTIEDGNKVLLENDNASGKSYVVACDIQCPKNDGTTLASSISFQSQTALQLFVRVKRSLQAPNSTGLTGSYDLRVTSSP